MMQEQDERMPWGAQHCQPDRTGEPLGRDDCTYHNWGYNEFILENTGSHTWNSLLPGAIRAVIIQGNERAHPDANVDYDSEGILKLNIQRATNFHRGFLARFNLAESEVPLLRYDWESTAGEPFTLWRGRFDD